MATSKKIEDISTPKTLKDLQDSIVAAAKKFGFIENKNNKYNNGNGIFKNCINSSPNDDDYWFGYIREGQGQTGGYAGLSFVIFPEKENNKGSEEEKHTHCLAAISVGSVTLSADSELASSPQFRRSFSTLTKGVPRERLFFKYKFDDLEQTTPLLQEYIQRNNYDDAMVSTINKYNKLLPAAMVVDYTNQNEFQLILAWLAQYAKWRNWASTIEGESKKGEQLENIEAAIKKCRVDASCPTPEKVKGILFKRRFIVLQGAPGCGKTWTAKQIAAQYFPNTTKFIQFHAETTYADFVYGIKPILNGQKLAYKGYKGVLLEILDLALKDSNNNYLLIIDEFNRANLANVLGPVFYLFEQNSGGNNLKLELGEWQNPEKDNEIEELGYSYIPDNLYVIATMNTADKSLAVVDFALRRRFSWVTLRPHKLDIKKYPDFDWELFDEVNELFMKYATDEELNLQPGQSYFMDKFKRKESIKYGLMPLMKEYFNGGYMLPARDEFMQLFYRETGIFMYE